MKYQTLIVEETNKLKKPTIYFFLKSNGFSEHFISNLRKNEDFILLNNKKSNLKTIIKSGDKIKVSLESAKPSTISECDGKLNIVFEDEDYLLINKPHNIPTIPSRSHQLDNLGGMVVRYMKEKDKNFVLRVLNRLDKETAGLVLVAKNIPAYNNIKSLQKTYYALCEGNLDNSSFDINIPIETKVENGINVRRREVSPNGKPALTHVQLIKNFVDFCLCSFSLETGRTHQIRVHMKSIGHPLIGDTIYNDKYSNADSHTFLILKKMSFRHPKTNEIKSFEIDFPEDWNL